MNGNDIVAGFRTALSRFFDEASAFLASEGPGPKAGSVAALERSAYSRPESLHTVAGIGTLLMESVGEHVEGFVKTITEPVVPITAWTCVRSMMESASIAAWVLDPTIDVKTRVGRSFAHRYEGMEQELKLLKAMGSPAVDVTKMESHITPPRM